MNELIDKCTALKTAVPKEYGWEWDNRFGTVLVCLQGKDSLQLKDNLSGIFENQFDSASIKKAGPREKTLAKAFSGLKAGQLLFTGNNEDNTLFCAWWPWGDTTKVSLRIGIYSQGADAEYEEQGKKNLKLWFDLK